MGVANRRAVKRGVDTVLDVLVERAVDRVCRRVGERKEVVFHRRGDTVVRGAVDTDRIRNLVFDVLGEMISSAFANRFSRDRWHAHPAIPTAPMTRHMSAGG